MDEHEQALRRQLSALFAEELADRVDELRRVAGELETEPGSPAARGALHRVLHVVKGASRSVGEEAIEGACHRLETLLAAGEPNLPIAALHDLADALAESRSALRSGAPIVVQRFARIAALAATEQDARDAPGAVPGGEDASATLRIAAVALDALVSQSADVLQARQSLTPVLRAFEQLRDEARVTAAASTGATEVAGRQWLRTLERSCRAFSTAVDRIVRSSELLDDQIRRLRLRPFEEVVAGCARIARDAAAALGKQVELTILARGVQLDRIQVEALRDVMVQLVRNSVAHGIESPELRRAAGKPECGQITIEATPRGDALSIQVRDDGGGVAAGWLRSLAAARGLVIDDPREAARLIFEPGVSSAPIVTELAGRGVGLDVVRQRVERLHGSVHVDWIANVGTTFALEIPITVATLRCMIVESNGVMYAVPISAVERLVWVTAAEIQRGETRELVRVGEDWLVVAPLASVLGNAASRQSRRAPGMVISQSGRRVVVAADRILDALEITFEPLDPRLGRLRCISGASTMPDGTVVLILQASDLVDAASGATFAQVFTPASSPRAPRSVLLADDSATTRALEANILRAAGYVVRTAVDGEDAWRQLSEGRCDIIVSDVDMPNVDGIDLTERVRASPELAAIPVVLVSARGSDADKARGMRAGANAYLVKSSFDQTMLLETLARLVS